VQETKTNLKKDKKMKNTKKLHRCKGCQETFVHGWQFDEHIYTCPAHDRPVNEMRLESLELWVKEKISEEDAWKHSDLLEGGMPLKNATEAVFVQFEGDLRCQTCLAELTETN
jgi:lipase chaperone LimK